MPRIFDDPSATEQSAWAGRSSRYRFSVLLYRVCISASIMSVMIKLNENRLRTFSTITQHCEDANRANCGFFFSRGGRVKFQFIFAIHLGNSTNPREREKGRQLRKGRQSCGKKVFFTYPRWLLPIVASIICPLGSKSRLLSPRDRCGIVPQRRFKCHSNAREWTIKSGKDIPVAETGSFQTENRCSQVQTLAIGK